ncbi:hypothetical protein KJZ24_04520 [Enterococcus faecalis]|uniref:hypothetical protein n=1 Tax=Enterococcus faecalis TaxID=1351 RepID=UPI00046C825F|nr:hypothetical protein [Enterococcus faecalis]EGO6069414.1 hypothetical protein [Enterococcus faecalis]EGO8502532.1 hypothetical protein [Enterococcus faecalis]EHV0153284.1 hypothetical protein [Enterococcus faecalis]MBJ1692935.1 hypothetical protein [Enterococcus faecalis]MCD4940467.1 hypothetical protein [Enterococcus faecalis]
MVKVATNYDRYGRMSYSPELHKNQGKVWTYEEVEYLKNWYAIIGPEEMSLALERTPASVMTKASSIGLKIKNYSKRLGGRQKKTNSSANELV